MFEGFMTENGTTISIDDLVNPQPTPTHQHEIDSLDLESINITEDGVLEEAKAKTGLSDLGPDDFRARLRTQIEDANNDANRTPLGRMIAFRKAVRWASTRLKLNALIKAHPEIEKEKIENPIVVIGLPRAGTTHLLNLLAADSRLRSLPVWESYDPVPPLEMICGDNGADLRLERAAKKWERTKKMLPYFAAMHPLEPDHINEDFELQGPNFAPRLIQGLAYVPPSGHYHNERNQQEHCEFLKLMLKTLQWLRGPRRWILKSPGHAEQISALMGAFPDATMVVIHRDPIPVVVSTITMTAYMGRLEFHNIDIEKYQLYWTERIEYTLKAVTYDRDAIPPDKIVDLHFEEFMQNKMSSVRKIYSKAELDLPPKDRLAMEDFLENHPRDKYGRIFHDTENLIPDIDQLRDKFSFYYDAFQLTT